MHRWPILLTLLGSLSASAAPLRYAEDRAPAIVNPLFATSMGEARVNELIFDSLFADDMQLRSAPRLAASIELGEGNESAILKLKQGVKWHDGKPVVANDVVFTIQAMSHPSTASSEAGRVAWIESAQALDPSTVQLNFVEPEGSPSDKLHFKILPSHAFSSPAVARADPFRTGPIGTGPWRLTSFNDDNSISLVANQDGGLHSAKIGELTMREVSDKNYQSKLLLYESLEALVRVLPRDLALLQSDRKIELHPYQTNSWWYFGFNHKNERLEDPLVREALSKIVSVDELLAPIGTGDVLSGPFVKSSPFYNHKVDPVRHDPAGAVALLKEAGYSFVGGKWLTPDGRPFTLRLATIANLETAQDVVINVQSQLQSAGISVKPEFLGVAEWKRRVWRDGDFDIVLSQWSFDRNEDIYEQFHSQGARNFIGYADPAVDFLLDEARTALDPQEKRAKLQEAHRQIAGSHPMVFLWTLDSYSAMTTHVKNVVVHPFYFFTWAPDWTKN